MLRFVRSRFKKIWDVRGGGLYAVGYIVTFLYFEVRTVIGEIADATGLADFLSDQLLGFVIRFATDSLVNMVKAFIWPVYIVQLNSVFGGIVLGVAFYIFPKYLKKPLEKKLFGEEREQSR